MAYGAHNSRQDRVRSLAGVVAVHSLLGLALWNGMTMEIARPVDAAFNVILVTPPQPPIPDRKPAEAEAGAASPENLQALESQIVAPQPEVKLNVESPVVVAPVAGAGNENKAGASNQPGPGFGSGGQGEGAGGGRGGDGTGSGGIVTGPQHLSGAISRKDIPRSVWKAGNRGNVMVRFTVGTDGRARGCQIRQSSGHPVLDATTCRLIEARFRFEPARDTSGRPVARPYGWLQQWWQDGRGPRQVD